MQRHRLAVISMFAVVGLLAAFASVIIAPKSLRGSGVQQTSSVVEGALVISNQEFSLSLVKLNHTVIGLAMDGSVDFRLGQTVSQASEMSPSASWNDSSISLVAGRSDKTILQYAFEARFASSGSMFSSEHCEMVSFWLCVPKGEKATEHIFQEINKQCSQMSRTTVSKPLLTNRLSGKSPDDCYMYNFGLSSLLVWVSGGATDEQLFIAVFGPKFYGSFGGFE